MNKLMKSGQVRVKDIIDNEVLDDPRFQDIKNFKVKVVDKVVHEGKTSQGLVDLKNKEILIKKQNKVRMDRILNHEIQHAIDYQTNSVDRVNGIAPRLKPQEQTTLTNELLFQAENLMNRGKSREEIEEWFDKKIDKFQGVDHPQAEAKTKRAKDAKTLFLRYLDEGKRVIA